MGQVLVGLGCGLAGRKFADRLQPDLHRLGCGDEGEELLRGLQLLAGRLCGDGVHPVAREVVALAVWPCGKLGDAPLEALDVAEGAEAEAAVDGHGGAATAEGGLALVHEACLADLVDALQVGIPVQRLGASLAVVGDLLVVVTVGRPTHLADEHLAPPMIVLTREVQGDALRQKVSSGVVLDRLLGEVEQLVIGLRRLIRVEARVLEKLPVVEERQRTHRRRQAIVFAVALHGGDDRVELFLDHRGREGVLRQRLHELRGNEVVEPSVKQLNDVGALAGGESRGDLRLVVGVGEGRVLDLDVGVCSLEAFDQLVHRLDAGVKHVLPVLDLDSLGLGARNRPDGDRQTKQHSSDATHGFLPLSRDCTHRRSARVAWFTGVWRPVNACWCSARLRQGLVRCRFRGGRDPVFHDGCDGVRTAEGPARSRNAPSRPLPYGDCLIKSEG